MAEIKNGSTIEHSKYQLGKRGFSTVITDEFRAGIHLKQLRGDRESVNSALHTFAPIRILNPFY